MARKNELTFQQKYKDRMDNIGKDGINGIVKGLNNPVENSKLDNPLEEWANMNKKGI